MQARNPNYAAATEQLFTAQPLMATLGARLASVAPGRVELVLPYRAELTQQDGFLHAGVATTLLDNACGGAAFSLMPAGSGVLSIEFKVNLLAPAIGETFVARAEVKRAGRSITVCQAELMALRDGAEKVVALMQATMMTVSRAAG